MSILTDRELVCLATLRRNWDRLYRDELAFLLSGDTERDDRSDSEWVRLDAAGWQRQQARQKCCA